MGKEYDARRHVPRPDEAGPDEAGPDGAGPEDAGTRRTGVEAAAAPDQPDARVVRVDRRTGNPAYVVAEEPLAAGADYVRRALSHLHRIGGTLGLADGQPAEYAPDPEVQRTSSGAAAVHLRQHYKGIPIYEAAETVRFDPTGRLTSVVGRTHTVLDDVAATPRISAEAALRRAAEHVAETDLEPPLDPFGQPLADPPLDLSDFDPEVVLVSRDRPDAAVTFRAPPFAGAVEVSLLWFPLAGELRLAWHTVLQVGGGGLYRVVVDAEDGALLLCRQLRRAIAGRATVWLRGGASPAETVDLPLPLDTYGLPLPDDLPAGFPDDWLRDATTDGANVHAMLPDGSTAAGEVVDDVVVFAPAPEPQDDDALLVNMLALNGLLHDLLYLLGFREADGNFQRDDVRGGRGSDAVRAIVHPGPVWGTANMATPPDGRAPEMNMGLVAATGRHTALDADVVVHEYCHGLTNRLVGGPLDSTALDGEQSGGMGEGWGDYFACLLSGGDTVGSWVVDRPGGIRLHPYTDAYPADFGALGTAPYTGVHAVGEVWCATLLTLTRRIGRALGAQVVVDAMKLAPANPSFLDMRDAILLASRELAAVGDLGDPAALERTVWEVFARYGMGPGAASDGDTLQGIVADHTVPQGAPADVPARVAAGRGDC